MGRNIGGGPSCFLLLNLSGFFPFFHEGGKNHIHHKVGSFIFLYFLYINFLHLDCELRTFYLGKKIVQAVSICL